MSGQNFTGTREMYHRWHRSRRFHVIYCRYRDDFRFPRVRDYRDGAVRRAQIDATNARRIRIGVGVGDDEELISSSAARILWCFWSAFSFRFETISITKFGNPVSSETTPFM